MNYLWQRNQDLQILYVIIINVYLDYNNVVIKWKASSLNVKSATTYLTTTQKANGPTNEYISKHIQIGEGNW